MKKRGCLMLGTLLCVALLCAVPACPAHAARAPDQPDGPDAALIVSQVAPLAAPTMVAEPASAPVFAPVMDADLRLLPLVLSPVRECIPAWCSTVPNDHRFDLSRATTFAATRTDAARTTDHTNCAHYVAGSCSCRGAPSQCA